MINKSTVNKLNEVINEADIVANETNIQEKGISIIKIIFIFLCILYILCIILNTHIHTHIFLYVHAYYIYIYQYYVLYYFLHYILRTNNIT